MTESRRIAAVNDRFYRAVRDGDLDVMERLWARDRSVTCTHPNWKTLVGRDAVMASWRMILTQPELPALYPQDTKVLVFGPSAMVLCVEELNGHVLMASNAFVREDGRWRIMNHQAAQIPGVRATWP